MKLFKHKYTKTGLPPGSLVFNGKKPDEKASINLISFNETNYIESEYTEISDCINNTSPGRTNWININGLHNTTILQEIGNNFNIHNLVLEDVLNLNHRPKIDIFDHYIFLTLKMLVIQDNQIDNEQVSLILGKNYVITFQEKKGDIFDPIRKRIKKAEGRVRQAKADYLFNILTDILVDNYYSITEFMDARLDEIEDNILSDPDEQMLQLLQVRKKDIIVLRNDITPLREAMHKLQYEENNLIDHETRHYFADIFDHVIHITDQLDSQRELLIGLKDLYLSSISHKMNKIMQVLTIIATIFIPLSFIVGVYGMNFDNIPELHLKHGYLYVWLLMLSIVITMLFFFKRKKWF
jgi:magnesium transporter